MLKGKKKKGHTTRNFVHSNPHICDLCLNQPFSTIDATILHDTIVKQLVAIKITKKWFVVAYVSMTSD
jgi:hypothetical protein